MRRWSVARFVLANVLVWVLMTIILVLVPDTLERWTSLEVARVIGWAVGYAVWVVAIEQHWRVRVGPLSRFLLQLVLWLSAAFLALWISEAARY